MYFAAGAKGLIVIFDYELMNTTSLYMNTTFFFNFSFQKLFKSNQNNQSCIHSYYKNVYNKMVKNNMTVFITSNL